MRTLSIMAAVVLLVACSKLPQLPYFDGPLGKPDPVEAGTQTGDGGRGGGDGKRRSDGGSKTSFDWRDGIMYFVLLDRFFDGDITNNKPVADVELAANYQGGDLQGLLQKLQAGFFDDLGINVLWLSSPVDAPDGRFPGRNGAEPDGHYYTGYHGYWPVELDQVESRLGDATLLQQVVTEAHTRGIRVLLDYVMNHVHQDSSVWKDHSDWFWPLNQSGVECLCGADCSWNPPEGLRCWFDPFLPTFNFTNAQGRAFSVGDAMSWAKNLGIDGYRLDAVKQIETSWITDLRTRANAELPGRFYMVGETFDGDKTLIKSLINPSTKLDGQFDFPLRASMVKTVLMRQGSMQDFDSFLTANDGYYGSNAVMGTFLGNHDLPRAIHLAEDTPLFTEWDGGKSRAWSDQPSLPTSAAPFERLAVGFTALLTLPGLPTIYYGDEIGTAGAGDPDNRKLMTFSGTTANQDKLRSQVKQLIQIRRQHPALRRGTRQKVQVTADLYAYRMTQGTDSLTVVLNRSDSTQSLQLTSQSSYKDLLSGETIAAGTISVPARSARILQ